MTLQEQLDQRREEFNATAPAEAREIMQNATKTLRESGIMDQVLKPGDKIPGFSLTDQNDTPVTSEALLAKGPLVIGFYRGVW